MKQTGPTISRRRFFGGVSLAAAGTAGYARFFEAERLQVRSYSVPVAGGSRPPLKVLHLSDLHASSVVSLEYISSAISQGLALRPDVICLTGDFITSKYASAAAYTDVLSRLSTAAACYAVLGNHDGGRWALRNGGYETTEWVERVLREARVHVLNNDSVDCSVNGWNLRLVGLTDAWSGIFNPSRAFKSDNPRLVDATILLSHNPDTKSAVSAFPWDLMLSGHTHGGQLRLPLLGTPFAPVRDKRYVSGLHRWSERWLHVTAGVGSVFGVRINCPPDIGLLTLT
jgi:predicted MPP superfamily phosphohydrolase